MSASHIYIAISIVVLALIALFVFVAGKGGRAQKLTPLAGLAFGFVLAGLFFGGERLIGYPLLGIGVVLAIVDMVGKLRSSKV